MQNSPDIRPPGTYFEIMTSPSDEQKSMEVAIVQDHRFAFYFWHKWRTVHGKRFRPPVLVSLDWHQDLTGPEDSERKELAILDPVDYIALARFCWETLNPLNDGHILAAAYLNLISDIHVLHKQDDDCPAVFVGLGGETHHIICYRSIDALVGGLQAREYAEAYFDIDLDYFTESAEPSGGGDDVKIASDQDIEAVLNPATPLMNWILERLAGMTIATEPEFCGGMANSNRIFNVIDETLFIGNLLSGYCDWKHLAK